LKERDEECTFEERVRADGCFLQMLNSVAKVRMVEDESKDTASSVPKTASFAETSIAELFVEFGAAIGGTALQYHMRRRSMLTRDDNL